MSPPSLLTPLYLSANPPLHHSVFFSFSEVILLVGWVACAVPLLQGISSKARILLLQPLWFLQ